MAIASESPQVTSRGARVEERYVEGESFGRCDSISCTYFVLSAVLCGIGITVTVLAFGNFNTEYQYDVGRGWALGPCLVLTGLMFAAKCMLYLRQKLIGDQMIQRQFIRLVQLEIGSGQPMRPSVISGASLPPPYESIVCIQNVSEMPPPTYYEATAALLQQQCTSSNTATDCQDVKLYCEAESAGSHQP